jgi:transmembrane sensor
MTALKDIRSQAADWLERQQRSGWNEQDASQLETWLAADPAHAVAYYRIEFAWQRTERLAALRPPQHEPRSLPTRFKAAFARSAAAIAIAAVAGTALYLGTRDPGTQTYATNVGSRKTLSLPDGSQIELNTNTTIRISKADNRRVWLDKGEAYFQVVHDAKHPFTVDIGQRRITDLGTKFDVRHDEQHLKISVVEGSVSLASKMDGVQSLILTRGDSVIGNGNALKVRNAPPQSVSDELGWRRGVLVFDNVTLAQAVSEFNRYTTGKIVIADPKAANLRIVGTFPTDGIEGFLDVAQHILKVRVERRGDQTVISH